jgi:two-component sensor histidine kinase
MPLETQQDLIAEETRHRLRNILALVNSTIQLSRVQNRTAVEFREVLLKRIAALTRFQTMDETGAPRPTDVMGVVRQELDDVCGPRLRIEPGPCIRLTPRQSAALGFILHELGTNAMKYGALSQLDGVVHLKWQVVSQTPPLFRFVWREDKGPPVVKPATVGFGSRLLQVAARDLGGGAQVSFDPSGVRVEISGKIS